MSTNLLTEAVHRNKLTSKSGILERAFTLMFRGFVYPQIWEDPEVDLSALELEPRHHMMTIASGGCNILNYMTASAAHIHAVDLNPAHVALTRLKLAAVRHMPDYETFYRFFGQADTAENADIYHSYLAPHLDPETRGYWEKRDLFSEPRIRYFTRNIYRYGLLGWFIGTVHWLAKMYGQDPKTILSANNMEEQRQLFDKTLAPLFDRKLVRMLCNMPISLFGLGIPPAQYHALKAAADGHISGLLRDRLERLACDFPVERNYFAWQAFARHYDHEKRLAVPPYLRKEHFVLLRQRMDRVTVQHTTMTGWLQEQGDNSVDRYVLLDAQDWMNEQQLTELWTEITRTAQPKARVVFRTAGNDSPLEQALPTEIRSQWSYDPGTSPDYVARDRSSIYGGFHVYRYVNG